MWGTPWFRLRTELKNKIGSVGDGVEEQDWFSLRTELKNKIGSVENGVEEQDWFG
jgi:hypothetical protein